MSEAAVSRTRRARIDSLILAAAMYGALALYFACLATVGIRSAGIQSTIQRAQPDAMPTARIMPSIGPQTRPAVNNGSTLVMWGMAE